MSDLRSRKGWEEVKKTVKKVKNRNISNEKAKQKKTIQPKGQGFEAIHELNDYISENDKYLIYKIDENSQYGLKTSRQNLI